MCLSEYKPTDYANFTDINSGRKKEVGDGQIKGKEHMIKKGKVEEDKKRWAQSVE